MSTSMSSLINEIKAEVKRIGQRIAKGVAQIAYEDMKSAHAEIMASFYGGYTPLAWYTYYYYKNNQLRKGHAPGYKRTGNLKNSIDPVGVIGGGLTYTAMVSVGSANMSDYTNNAGRSFPGSAVFDLVWNQGIRGLPPGYKGYVGEVAIDAAPVGIGISGHPGEAMDQFVDEWISIRAPQVADQVAGGI